MMLDAESLVDSRLKAAIVDAPVYSELQDDIDFPAVIYSVTGDGQTGNGPGIWPVHLEVSVIATADKAFGLASQVYDTIHGWPLTGDEYGTVVSVTDVSLPSKVSSTTSANSKTEVQYTGSFDLLVRH